MRFCDEHWGKLKTEIKKRGMEHLIAPSGEVAINRLVTECEDKGNDNPEAHDPLMAATNAIYYNALQTGGLYLLSGEYCPLCELDEHGGDSKDWINRACQEQEDYCKENNLI